MTWNWRLLTALLLLAACNPEVAEERERPERAPTMMVDGVAWELARSPSDFDVYFSTYVPPDMTMEVLPDEQTESVRFVKSDTAGAARESFVHVFFFPRTMSRDNAQIQLESFVASRGVPVSERESMSAPLSEEGIPPESGPPTANKYAWSIWESAYEYNCAPPSDACRVGRAMLGEHKGRLFQVIVQYPPALSDSFEPRAHQILDHWQFE